MIRNDNVTNGVNHSNKDNEFENELLYFNTNQQEIKNTEIYKFQKLIEQTYEVKLGILFSVILTHDIHLL
jgi:hypothetical protein